MSHILTVIACQFLSHHFVKFTISRKVRASSTTFNTYNPDSLLDNIFCTEPVDSYNMTHRDQLHHTELQFHILGTQQDASFSLFWFVHKTSRSFISSAMSKSIGVSSLSQGIYSFFETHHCRIYCCMFILRRHNNGVESYIGNCKAGV